MTIDYNDNKERNEAIFWERVNEGTNFSKIGKKYEITGARVQQIVEKQRCNYKNEIKTTRLLHKAIKNIAENAATEYRNITKLIDQLYAIDNKKIDGSPKTPLYHLEISVRLLNCLKNEGLEFLEDIENLTEANLLRIPNFGKSCLDELKEIANDYGVVIGSKSTK